MKSATAAMPATNMYCNNVAPYTLINPLQLGLNGSKDVNELTKLDPLAKLGLADTCHDLAYPRKGYSETFFRENFFSHIISGLPSDNKTDHYNRSLTAMFEGSVGMSHFEPSVNAYIENVFGLQPAYEGITFDKIVSPPPEFSVDEIIDKSNGSLKITVPHPYTSFTHYLTQFVDENTYHNAQEKISIFIKNFLHRPKNVAANVSEIRFLFDAGANQLGKIFNFPDSGGIRYNAMACTADSASTSDSALDPNKPNEYEEDRVVNVRTNFFTNNMYDINFIVNPDCSFGVHGTTCFSVNITPKPQLGESAALPTSFDKSARYFFGKEKNKTKNGHAQDDDPCGSEGASVSHIGRMMLHLETWRSTFQSENTAEQAAFLNSVKNHHTYNSSCIPIGDSRFLNLFPKKRITQDTEIDTLLKLLADYKRTGDYEQSLALKRKIKDEKNELNYTFSSVDLLSTLFARMNGIPAIYQVGVNGTLTLYRNELGLGSPGAIQRAKEAAAAKIEERLQETTRVRYDRLAIIKTTFNEIINKLKTLFFKDNYTELRKIRITEIFTNLFDFLDSIQPDEKKIVFNYNPPQSDKTPESASKDIIGKIEFHYITIDMNFPLSLSLVDKKITEITDDNKFTLPFLDFIVSKGVCKQSTELKSLESQQDALLKRISANENDKSEKNMRRQQERLDQLVVIEVKINDMKKTMKTSKMTGGGEKRKASDAISENTNDVKKTKIVTTGNTKGTKKNASRHTTQNGTRKNKQQTPPREIKPRAYYIELNSIINKVLYKSNGYLKDLFGNIKYSLECDRKKRRIYKVAPKERDNDLITNMNQTRKLLQIKEKKTKKSERLTQKRQWRGGWRGTNFLSKNTIETCKLYSDASNSFLSSMLYEYLDSLETLVINYNYNSISTDEMTISILFENTPILTYMFFFLTTGERNNDNYQSYKNYLEQTTWDKLLKKMNAVHKNNRPAVSLSVFAQVGYSMNIFHKKDFCFDLPSKHVTQLQKLHDFNVSPIQNFVKNKYLHNMNNAIELFAKLDILEVRTNWIY